MPALPWRITAAASALVLGAALQVGAAPSAAAAAGPTSVTASALASTLASTRSMPPLVRAAGPARPSAPRAAVARAAAKAAAARAAAAKAAAAAATTGATTAASRPATAQPTGPAFGAQFHGMWSSYTDAQRDRVLATLAGNGVRNVRIDLSWAMLQPKGPDSYDPWGVGFADSVIDRAVAHGLTPHITFWLTPAWANGGRGEHTLPTDPADYARAAAWVAKRWAGKVAAYEVWNEPNSPAFLDGADPVAYARLVRAAYPAFHAGDPSTSVVLGGTSYVDVPWVKRVLAAGAARSFDVVGVNPYMGRADASPTTPDDGSIWTMRHVAVLRQAVVAAGRGDAPIWFTEFGWSARPTALDAPNWARGVTPEQQAQFLVETVRMVRAEMPYVTKVFWYQDLVDIQPGFHGGYGLVNQDGTPTLALRAVRGA